MKEAKGELFETPSQCKIITTNGFVKKNGSLVMGAGCAKTFAEMYPEAPLLLGQCVQDWGNNPYLFKGDTLYITMPVKRNWFEKASLELIRASALKVRLIVSAMMVEEVLSPRPGCGNGGRDWETEVRPILNAVWDDRFTVITW